MPIDYEKGIQTRYRFYLEAVHVQLDSSWSPGSIVWFKELDLRGWQELFREENCPAVLQWKPHQPKYTQSNVVIGYSNDACERNDIVMAWDDVDEMAREAEYRQQEAHIEITRIFSFGTSTCQVVVRRQQWYCSAKFNQTITLGFASSDDCIRFIQQDMTKLQNRDVGSRRYITDTDRSVARDDRHTIIDDVCQTVAPFTFDHRHAQTIAIQRGLSRSEFEEEFTEPKSKLTLIHHSTSTSTPHGGDPACQCYLILHLSVLTWTYELSAAYIHSFEWSATNIPSACPSGACSFGNLSNLHLNFPSTPSEDNCDSRNSGALAFTVAASGIQGLTATNSVAAGNSVTITSEHRNIRVNFPNARTVSVNINFISGDAYFGAITSSNIGGVNNMNVIHMNTNGRPRSPCS
ncbi:hypothetical protein PTI98_013375 [Pleurotus ostreatus]|nr:hypothetical protein PTI98_013375 [Pleurotus ostreatus]